MTTITFDPHTPGPTESWDNDQNWSPQVVPQGNDVDVLAPTIYRAGAPYRYDLFVAPSANNTSSYDIRSLVLGADETLDLFAPLYVAQSLTDNGDLVLNGPPAGLVASLLHIGEGGMLSATDYNSSPNPQILDIPVVNDGIIAAEGTFFSSSDIISPTDLVVKTTVLGNGFFELLSPPQGSGEPGEYLYGGTLELQGAQSQNVLFSENGTLLRLDDPSQFSGNIATLAAHLAFTVALPSIAYADVTGYSYEGNSQSGTLVIDTKSGDLTLNFLGTFSNDDFQLSPVRASSSAAASTEITITQHQVSPPVVYGEPTQQTFSGQALAQPFGSAQVITAGELHVRIVLGAPRFGALSLANASSFGVTGVNFDAATGTFTMSGDAQQLTQALRALVFTPSYVGLPAGVARHSLITALVSGGGFSTFAKTIATVVNGATVAQALDGEGGGYSAIVDTAANLSALTADQISTLAKLGFTRLVSSDASVFYNVAQSEAIVAAQMTIRAPATDEALERFATKTVTYVFDQADLLLRRVTTSASQIDVLTYSPGAVAGQSYVASDARFIGGQRQEILYYQQDGNVVSETFPAAGVTEYRLAGPTEIYSFAAEAQDVTIHFAPHFGSASVGGFDTAGSATNVLDISALFPSFAAARAAMTEAAGTIIKDSAGDVLHIANIAPGQLTSRQLGFG